MPSAVALVTSWLGTAGPEIVVALERAGFQVLANTTEEDLLMAGAGQNVMAVEFDPSIEGSVRERLGAVVSIFGGIDVLVNNPLAWADAALDEITEAMWAEVIAKNVKSTFYCSRIVANMMQARGGGRIINVTSSAGLTGAHTPFAVSCAGVMSLTRSMAIELAPAIRVNCVATGLLDEPWIDDAGEEFRRSLESKVPLNRLCQPADVAEFVAYLANGGDFFTGQTFVLDGGEIRR
jgi:3-oxoacyl-[acyl-carrier protein] reductase